MKVTKSQEIEISLDLIKKLCFTRPVMPSQTMMLREAARAVQEESKSEVSHDTETTAASNTLEPT